MAQHQRTAESRNGKYIPRKCHLSIPNHGYKYIYWVTIWLSPVALQLHHTELVMSKVEDPSREEFKYIYLEISSSDQIHTLNKSAPHYTSNNSWVRLPSKKISTIENSKVYNAKIWHISSKLWIQIPQTMRHNKAESDYPPIPPYCTRTISNLEDLHNP